MFWKLMEPLWCGLVVFMSVFLWMLLTDGMGTLGGSFVAVLLLPIEAMIWATGELYLKRLSNGA
jgi:hypothetical protein